MKRNILAITISILTFWFIAYWLGYVLSVSRLFDFLVTPEMALKVSPSQFVFMSMLPFLLSCMIGGIISGITGTLALRERNYLLIALPVTIFEAQALFYPLFDTEPIYSIIMYFSAEVATVFLSCLFGIWISSRIITSQVLSMKETPM